MSCSNAAKTRNPLKFAGVPKTPEPISAASRRKFTILYGHVGEILLLNKFFFPIIDTCFSCEDIARQNCGMVPRWRFFCIIFASCISASHVQHISNMHSKFTLRPYHVWKKGKERKSIYIAPLHTKVHTKRSGMDHTVLPANNTMHAFPS